jgi:hypothetical protein
LLEINQIVAGELFAIDRVRTVLGDVSLNQATFKDVAYTYCKLS